MRANQLQHSFEISGWVRFFNPMPPPFMFVIHAPHSYPQPFMFFSSGPLTLIRNLARAKNVSFGRRGVYFSLTLQARRIESTQPAVQVHILAPPGTHEQGHMHELLDGAACPRSDRMVLPQKMDDLSRPQFHRRRVRRSLCVASRSANGTAVYSHHPPGGNKPFRSTTSAGGDSEVGWPSF